MLERAPRFFAPKPPNRDQYLTDGSFAFEHTGGVRDMYFLELPQPCTLKLSFECEVECMVLVRTSDGSFGERKDGSQILVEIGDPSCGLWTKIEFERFVNRDQHLSQRR